MQTLKFFTLRPVGALVLSTFLSACAVGPDYLASPEKPVHLSQALSPELYSSERLQQDWWRQFQDPQLDQLIDLALQRNHDIRIAQARLLEARAVLDQRQLDQLPAVTAAGDYSRSRSQANPGPAGDRNLAKSYRAGLDAQWELDLFGRLRRLSEASAARSEVVEADLTQVRIVVVAEVARTYFEMRGVHRQLQVANANLGNQAATVQVVQAMVSSGRGTYRAKGRVRQEN